MEHKACFMLEPEQNQNQTSKAEMAEQKSKMKYFFHSELQF
jgi:hypothetical protein